MRLSNASNQREWPGFALGQRAVIEHHLQNCSGWMQMCSWRAGHQQIEEVGREASTILLFLHCEQMDAACLSKSLPFSNWGRKQKFIALFFKALTQHIFKHVFNTLFLPISSRKDFIQPTPCKRGEWGKPTDEKQWESMPATLDSSLPGSCREVDLDPCSFCSLKLRLFFFFDWFVPVTMAWDLEHILTMMGSSQN